MLMADYIHASTNSQTPKRVKEGGMKTRYLPLIGLTLLVVMVVAVPGFGQSTGTVRGAVKDPSGAVLPGVTVAVTNIATQQKTETISTETGTYTFAFLMPGDYTLQALLPGFNPFTREKIHVEVAGAVVLDVVLQVEGRTE